MQEMKDYILSRLADQPPVGEWAMFKHLWAVRHPQATVIAGVIMLSALAILYIELRKLF